jgi:DNA-binding transcriptional MerR regulator
LNKGVEIQALCDAVNQLIVAEGIEIENGRTSSLVTPRNIRYYCTIGIMPAPKRFESKSTYDDSHVEAVMAIKRSQMVGMSLKEIKAQQQPEDGLHALSESIKANMFSSISLNSMMTPRSTQYSLPVFAASDSRFGWTVTVGNHQLSGFGDHPNQAQLVAIERILEFDPEESDSQKADEA